MSNILVTGAYGLLGCSLCTDLLDRGHTVFRQGRRESADICLDPLDSDLITKLVLERSVDTIINLIAATDVEACEENPTEAYQANAEVVESIVASLLNIPKRHRPHLVHISSDQVYDGRGPHVETEVKPCNVYAQSKYSGELKAAEVGATIIRTNFLGRSRCLGRASLSDWIVESLKSGKKITVFQDILISAIHVSTLCSAISLIIGGPKAGTYNVGCSNGNSKAFLAIELSERLGLDRKLLEVGLSSDIKKRTRRPSDMRMVSDRFEREFGFAAPTFESQIDITSRDYIND